MKLNLKKYIGDKAFYRMVLAVALPIMLQNGISNFVNLLDNVMIGSLGSIQLSAVSIANQLIFVYQLCVFGAVSGAGIFTAQYHGSGDVEGVRHSMRLKVWISLILTGAAAIAFLVFGKTLISLWLNDAEHPEEVALTLEEGYRYLALILIGLLPMGITQCYADTLRSTGETVLPMRASLVALFVNMAFNWLFIFPHFGHFGWGVVGAAVATVIARFTEFAVLAVAAHRQPDAYPFTKGLFRTMRVPLHIAKTILITGLPLMLNESFWGLAMTLLNRNYSLRGLVAVDAVSISSTVTNIFHIAITALGSAVGIIIGNTLGSGDLKKAKDYDTKLIAFSTAAGVAVGALLAAAADLMTLPYNVPAETAHAAATLMRITALFTPCIGFLHASYFTLRSGGKTLITMLFDSVSLWVLVIPLSLWIGYGTSVPLIAFYFICQLPDLPKCIFGYILVKKGIWMQNLVQKSDA